ncbi:hypothetical protein CHARACLAT_004409 [Characodon lateralis]|uniref:Uncharacterized protein n=1 Tax=Characodon lateralis TaxID=208331 RepID=A0ABU7E0U3_9TELE|nr:hypothetical protein [Characodon lateralis]
MKTNPQTTLSTHSPTPSIPAASCPPPYSMLQWQGKDPAQLHPVSAYKRDTTKHLTHIRPPDLTPRWDKLTWQAIPGQRHGPGANSPYSQPHKHTTSPPLQRQPREKHQPAAPSTMKQVLY